MTTETLSKLFLELSQVVPTSTITARELDAINRAHTLQARVDYLKDQVASKTGDGKVYSYPPERLALEQLVNAVRSKDWQRIYPMLDKADEVLR